MEINEILLVKNKEIIIKKLIGDYQNNMRSLQLTLNNIINLEFEKIFKQILDFYKDKNHVDINNEIKSILDAKKILLMEYIKAIINTEISGIEIILSNVKLDDLNEEIEILHENLKKQFIELLEKNDLKSLDSIYFLQTEVENLFIIKLTGLIKGKLQEEVLNRNLIITNIFKETYDRYILMNNTVKKPSKK